MKKLRRKNQLILTLLAVMIAVAGYLTYLPSREESVPAMGEQENSALMDISEEDVLAVKDLAVNGNDLLALGLRGKQIGQALDIVLGAVIDERLENEKEAELAWLRSVYEL